MNIDKLFKEIETIEHEVKVTIHGGLRPVCSAMLEDPLTQKLLDKVKKGKIRHALQLVVRIEQLSENEPTPAERSANYVAGSNKATSYDSAVFTYLLVLRELYPGFALEVSKRLVSLHQFFYAQMLVRDILKTANENVRNYTDSKLKIYLSGKTPSQWQDRVKEAHPQYDYMHRKSVDHFNSIEDARESFKVISHCDVVFAYLENTEQSDYNTALEMGFAHSLGKKIIMVSERTSYISMLHYCANVNFYALSYAIDALEIVINGLFTPTNNTK